MAAGRLDRRLRFEKRQEVENGAGNFVAGFVAQFECAAHVMWMRGTEAVMAARLESRQPAILTIRVCEQAKQIGNDWRAVDVRDPRRVYNIRELPRETEDRAFFEMLAESGVAT